MKLNNENGDYQRADCPSAETLLQFQRTKLSRKEEETIRRHIVGCAACAQDSLLIAKTLKHEKSLIREMREKYFKKSWHGIFAFRYVATGLVIVFIGIIALNNLKNRAVVDEHQMRGIEITTIEPVQVLKADGQVAFRWKAVPKNEFYVVEIYGDSLEFLWKSDKIHEEFYSLPENFLRTLKAGKQYAWTVTAHFTDARTLKSALAEFRIQ
jgi:hypothetical protein